ncbi:MAG: hypothetical protein ACYCOX_18585, partial [Acidobacteriaceae bacterium]
MTSILIALLCGFCGGLLSHFIWTSGLLATVEVRLMRARSGAAKIWMNERAAIKNEISKQHIRILGIEKKL